MMHCPTETSKEALKNLSLQDWQQFGTQYLAYMRPIHDDGITACAVYAANGECLGVLEDARGGLDFVQQQELMPVTVQ
jgi:hypothetical protein